MASVVTVVIGTRNRAPSLDRALESLFASDPQIPFEVIVVDNGSTDETANVVERRRAAGYPVRFVIEPQRGVAYAKNAGTRLARAPVVAFMDDDQHASALWLASIARHLHEGSGLDFLAGRVLPAPHLGAMPAWVTPETGGALSIIDRGTDPRPIDAEHWMCVPGGNMACRRDLFLSVGGFGLFTRSQDRELTVRLLQRGCRGLYVPDMLQYHDIEPSRISRHYLRRWNAVEGRTRARYRFLELFDRDGRLLPEPMRGRRLFGVSLFVYREWLREIGQWAAATVKGESSSAFAHELKARYLSHYLLGAVRSRY